MYANGQYSSVWMNHMVDSEYGGFMDEFPAQENVFPELLRALF